MKVCPFCCEEIKYGAVKCRYCGSNLSKDAAAIENNLPKVDLEPNQVLLVLDRGFLYFAKFVLGVVFFVLALATAYFGFDLNKAREDVDQTSKEVQQDVGEMKKGLVELQNARTSVEATLSKVTAIGDDAQKLLEQVLNTAQQEAAQIHIAFISTINPPPPVSSTAEAAPSARPFTVPEIAALYHFPTEQNGAGQTIALIELGGGYRDTDLRAYFAELHLSPPQVVAVSVSNGGNQPGDISGADGQVTGDIEVAGAVAPGAKIAVYFAPNTDTGFAAAIGAAAHDANNKPSIISISWGAREAYWTPKGRAAINSALKEAAKLGITVLVAAGDSGVSDGLDDGSPHVDFPASSPWVLAVGGTSLLANDGEIRSETVWNTGGGIATGGGISEVFSVPDWQRDVNSIVLKNGSRGRGIPDVAAIADPSTGYKLLLHGQTIVLGGTAMATPLWAGLIARLNQALGRNLGYINPTLYIGIGPAETLRRISGGDNGNGKLKGYAAGNGWSPVSGWGTPDGDKLLAWLRGHPKATASLELQ